jgi:hypothetical protein
MNPSPSEGILLDDGSKKNLRRLFSTELVGVVKTPEGDSAKYSFRCFDYLVLYAAQMPLFFCLR